LNDTGFLKVNWKSGFTIRSDKDASNRHRGMFVQIKASSHFQKLDALSKARGPIVLRLRVESGGCGGFSYLFDIVKREEVSGEDMQFEEGGQKVVIDDVSMSFLKDCEIDYHQEMVRSSFRVVKNAMADTSCGCGTSFSVGE